MERKIAVLKKAILKQEMSFDAMQEKLKKH